ncbi:MAG: hypothetical protein ACTHQM_10175 [Thermoanaerobaculia bacterium]
MQLGKDSCACAHSIDHHDGGRGGPCNYCACAAGEPPTAFQVGMIHALHVVSVGLARVVKELQAHRGGVSSQ